MRDIRSIHTTSLERLERWRAWQMQSRSYTGVTTSIKRCSHNCHYVMTIEFV